MKKLKVFVVTIIILVLLVMGYFSFVYKGARSTLQPTSTASQEDLVKKGEYLARAGDCVACHTDRGGKPFVGGLAIESPIGAIYSTNITPDKANGLGNYTLQDFDNAVRYGVRKDGVSLYPAMPFPDFAVVKDEDIEALYAYFMHGVKASPEANKKPDITWPLSMRWPLAAWRMMFAPEVRPFTPALNQDVVTARGAYLVQGLGHCGSCHTPRAITLNEKAYSQEGNSVFLSGSNGLLDGWIANNLRADYIGGLGQVSEEELAAVLKTGRNQHGAVFGGMTDVVVDSLQYLIDDDITAIARYLKTLPPVNPSNPPYVYDETVAKALFKGDASKAGAMIYLDNCAACHRTDGKGYAQTFPALAGNHAIQQDNPASVINIIIHGQVLPGTQGAPTSYTMPGLGWRLSDQEIADVATFVRSSWGNKEKAVTAAEVAQQRKSLKPEHVPYRAPTLEK